MTIPASALDPFFDARVAVQISRDGTTRKGTLPAAIYDEGHADAIAQDASADSIADTFALQVRKIDWFAAFPSPPAVGDRFTSPYSGKSYALVDFAPFDFDLFSITARQIS